MAETESATVTAKWANVIANIGYDDLPPEAVNAVKTSVLDTLGALLAGTTSLTGERAANLLPDFRTRRRLDMREKLKELEVEREKLTKLASPFGARGWCVDLAIKTLVKEVKRCKSTYQHTRKHCHSFRSLTRARVC